MNHSFLTAVQAVSQAIADVEKMEQEEHANRKALLEAKLLPDSKEADEKRKVMEDISEDVQMLMEMPVVVENSGAEPETVAEVIEVPTQGSGADDTDIIIVDSSMLVGQEEAPPDTQVQLVDVVLDGKNGDGSKQDVSEDTKSADQQEPFKNSGEIAVSLSDKTVTVQDKQWDSVMENKQDDLIDRCSPDATDVKETVIEDGVVNKDVGMAEGLKIEVVATEVPTSKAEEKETNKTDKKEELDKEKVESLKRDEDEIMVEKQQDTLAPETTECDRAVHDAEQSESAVTCAATTEPNSCEESDRQEDLDSCETKTEVVADDVEKEVIKESLEDEVEDDGKSEEGTADGVKEDDVDGNMEGMKDETKKQDTEAEDLMTETYEGTEKYEAAEKCEATEKSDATEKSEAAEKYGVTEKISEVTEEGDSRPESSEDEKKADKRPWTVAEHGEELVRQSTRCSNFVLCFT